MKFTFNYKKKNFEIEVEECKTLLSKFMGLMFKKKSKPLLFVFKNPTKQAIHSFFCMPFVIIWFDGEKVIDVKNVKPWKFFVRPREKFDKLLEIPSSSNFFREFIDEAKV